MRFCNLKTRSFVLMLVLFGLVSVFGADDKAASAEKFPAREVELIIQFGPGGSTDMMARIIGERVSKHLGVPVVCINKPGASGAVASSYVASKTDGYTVGTAGASNLGTLLATESNVPYTLKDFSGVARAVTIPIIFVTKKGRFATLQDVIKEAKQKPGVLTYSSWGAKSTSHLIGELFNQVAGIKLKHVPFSGGGKQMAAMLGGHVDMAISTPSTTMPHIRGGNLIGLAITSNSREVELPEVATMKELGFPEATFVSFDGFAAGSKVPKDRLAIINAAFEKSIKDPEVQELLKKNGMPAAYLNGEDYDKLLANNLSFMKKIADSAGIKD
jgi:tripartite-type tricarboxylate transporter receptor subunit TctC